MSERLEEQLHALGAELFPPEPDLRAAVLARLDAAPRRRRHARPLLALVALVLAVAAAALAIPQARSALERWLGFGAARIVRVDTLPPLTRGTALTGTPATEQQAARTLGGTLYLPHGLAAPDERLRALGFEEGTSRLELRQVAGLCGLRLLRHLHHSACQSSMSGHARYPEA